MSCRCERLSVELLRRNFDNRLLMVEVSVLGRVFRFSNNRINKRFISFMVFRQYLYNEFILYDNLFFKNLFRKISYKIFYNSRNCKFKVRELILCFIVLKFYFLFFLSLFFMAFGRFERRRLCVMVGEFRYSVDSRLIIVEILGLDFVFCILIFFGVLVVDILGFEFFVC